MWVCWWWCSDGCGCAGGGVVMGEGALVVVIVMGVGALVVMIVMGVGVLVVV